MGASRDQYLSESKIFAAECYGAKNESFLRIGIKFTLTPNSV